MGRKKTKLHELKLRNYDGYATCWWQDRKWRFGPWDKEADAPTAESMEQFRAQVAIWQTDPTSGLRADDYLVSEMCADWMQSSASPRAGTRAIELARESMLWLVKLYSATPALEFGSVEFRAWQDWMCQQVGGKSGKRMRHSTIMVHRRNVIRAVKYAVSMRRLPAATLTEIETVTPPSHGQALPSERRLPISGQSVKLTLPQMPPPVAAIARLLWWTGARVEELIRLKAGDIVRSGVIETPFAVRMNLDRFKGHVWAAVLVKHKTDKIHDRVLFFGPRAQRVLMPLLEHAQPTDYLFRPDWFALQSAREREERKALGLKGPTRNRPAPTAKSKPGQHYTPGTLLKAVARATKRAGVSHWYPRQLRQAFARRMISKGVGQSAVACCLGHAGIGVTFRYTDRDLVTAARVYAKHG